MSYDSRKDTLDHIEQVRQNIADISMQLHRRAIFHDESKLHDPEKEVFDRIVPLLKDTDYGSDEYRATLKKEMNTGIKHHYEMNDHHPEHFENGIKGMSLLSLMEMLADWKAANDRKDGDFAAGLRQNQERFNISEELMAIIYKTCEELWWI